MVRKLKSLGQHFLKNESVLNKIVEAVDIEAHSKRVLEVGPGLGALTRFLVEKEGIDLKLIELDTRLPEKLLERFPKLKGKVIRADFLKTDMADVFREDFSVVGNFPYNVSSQIVFKVIDNRKQVSQMVGMFQKEVAQRIASVHGNKVYGVVSVLVQAYYKVEYLFEVPPEDFSPPPKVWSAVIRLVRRDDREPFDHQKLRTVVKTAFLQRRKKMKNTLKALNLDWERIDPDILSKRPEQLSVNEFLQLSQYLK